MAVSAPHIALGDFVSDRGDREAPSDGIAEVKPLLRAVAVIELKYDWIADAAIETWMARKVFGDESADFAPDFVRVRPCPLLVDGCVALIVPAHVDALIGSLLLGSNAHVSLAGLA